MALDFGIYNVRKATCSGGCGICNGEVEGGAVIVDDPFGVAVRGTHQLSFQITWNTGGVHDYTTLSNWSSKNTAVGTVSKGLVSGVAPGSVTITTFVAGVPQANQCSGTGGTGGQCATSTALASSPGTVQVPTDSRIVPPDVANHSISATTQPACPSGQVGWYRRVHKIVTDQETPAKDIALDGATITESLGNATKNDLNLSKPTPFPPAQTSGGGFFDDQLGFCSSLCPGSSGESDFPQILTDQAPNSQQYTLKQHSLQYTCKGNSIDGQ